jgi:hypothetical protein
MNKGRVVVLFLMLANLLIPSSALSQQTAIDNGISWLRANQNEDGSWGDRPTSIATPFHATCAVANTLYYLGVSDTIYSNAIQWITNQEIISNRYLYWKIEALTNSGTDVSGLVNSLVSYRIVMVDGAFMEDMRVTFWIPS